MNVKIKYSLFFFIVFSNIIYCQIDEKTIIIKSPSDEELIEKRIDEETLKKMEFLSKLDTVYVAFKKSDRQKIIKGRLGTKEFGDETEYVFNYNETDFISFVKRKYKQITPFIPTSSIIFSTLGLNLIEKKTVDYTFFENTDNEYLFTILKEKKIFLIQNKKKILYEVFVFSTFDIKRI